MSKKKSSKAAPVLSPENYIRQKSKNLPIHKCLINQNWEEAGEANIIIERRHVTGNVTACVYLVDLQCLGVKDSFYIFNTAPKEVDDKLNDDDIRNKEDRYIEISYPLAHNIIYAGVEFAEEYEFHPYKAFTSVTQFFLENDTDDIPLMEIPCGDKETGNPLYINAGNETIAHARQIINQLERVAGKGNYHYMFLDRDDEREYEKKYKDEDEDFDDEDFDDEYRFDDEEYEIISAEIRELDFEAQKNLFKTLLINRENSKEEMSSQDSKRVLTLSDILSPKIADTAIVDEQYHLFEEKYNCTPVENYDIPNTLFAEVENGNGFDLVELFYNAIEEEDEDENYKETLAAFKEKAGDVPAAHFLDLYYLKQSGSPDYAAELKKYYQQYPDYFLIQLLYSAMLADEKAALKEEIEKLFIEKKLSLTKFEVEYFFFVYALYLMKDKSTALSTIVAYEKYILLFDFVMINFKRTILLATSLFKVQYLQNHFGLLTNKNLK
jgi:hypothetical protein